MRALVAASLAVAMAASVAWAQPSQIIDDVMPAGYLTVDIDHDIPLKIYLPPDHDPTGPPYRVYIYLHGAYGHDHAACAAAMKPVLDQLIGDGAIDPLVVVWPDVVWPGAPDPDGVPESFGNYHTFTDSDRNGDHDSVISVDLVRWLAEPEQHAVPCNLAATPDMRAIGGFSMGAGGAIRMGARHPGTFSVVIGQSGIISLAVVKAGALSLLLPEYPEGPPYVWDPDRGYFSNLFFAWSASFSPDPAGNLPLWGLDFPVDAQTGTWIPEIMDDVWLAQHDPIALYAPLKEPAGEPGEFTLPVALYFDVDAGEINRQFGDGFDAALAAEGIVGYEYQILPGSTHAIQPDAVTASLLFLDAAMDGLVTPAPAVQPDPAPAPIALAPSHPNPFNPATTLTYRVAATGHVRLAIFDLAGSHVATLVDAEVTAGSHTATWNGCDRHGRPLPSGTYVARLESAAGKEARKLTLVR